jgi:hypothetical protein
MIQSTVWPPIQEDPRQPPDARDPIATALALLRPYPQVQVEAGPDHVTVYPRDSTGFTVVFRERESTYTVACDGWRAVFASQNDALQCFALALSPDSRLQVWRCGDTPYRWAFQLRQGNNWVRVTERRLIFFPFWRPRTTALLQNRLLAAA